MSKQQQNDLSHLSSGQSHLDQSFQSPRLSTLDLKEGYRFIQQGGFQGHHHVRGTVFQGSTSKKSSDTSSHYLLPTNASSPLKLPQLSEATQPLSTPSPREIYQGKHTKSINRKPDKGVEMFAMTIKQKEVDFHMQLMENRLKKLQDEEERAMKKIN